MSAQPSPGPPMPVPITIPIFPIPTLMDDTVKIDDIYLESHVYSYLVNIITDHPLVPDLASINFIDTHGGTK